MNCNQHSKKRLFQLQQIKEKRKQQLLTNIHQIHTEVFYLKSAQDSNLAYHRQQQLMDRNRVLQDLNDHV